MSTTTKVLILFWLLSAARAAPAQETTQETTRELPAALAESIQTALARNPRLRSESAGYQSSVERISQVTSLPDLKLGYTEFLQSVETRVGPQERAFSVSQSFPWFGVLSLQGDVQREKAEASRARLQGAVLEIVAEVKKTYYDIAYLEQAIEITEQHVGLLTQWEEVARARYATGTVQYTDVVKSQVELGVLLDRLAGLRDQRRPLEATMNALLDRDSATRVVIDGVPSIPAEEPDLAALAATMKAKSPLLATWDHRARESLNSDRLAKKQGYPSFSLGMNYILTGQARMDGVSDSGQDALTASLGVNIPLWRGQYQAASRAAVKNYEAAVASKQDTSNRLEAALQNAHFRYRDAHRKLRLYETTLLPKAHQSLDATRSAYEAGANSFLDLVDTQRLVLEFELTSARARFDVLVHQSEIERIVGSSLSPIEE